MKPSASSFHCAIYGLGIWGPGFNSWSEFCQLDPSLSAECVSPKPEIIPANERRRAPLPVRAAVEVSWQALQQSGFSSADVACVFGSGLGDTEITDYMCRVLCTPEKQLSPTKFHNSVHNAAAGYWTISSACMRSANSIAAYHYTAGISLLEAVLQVEREQQPVLITLFDTAAHGTYRDIFPCSDSFAAALLIGPSSYSAKKLASLELSFDADCKAAKTPPALNSLSKRLQDNPAAAILPLLEVCASPVETASLELALSAGTGLNLLYRAGQH